MLCAQHLLAKRIKAMLLGSWFLQIELGEQLSQAGSLGSVSHLTGVLLGLLGGKPTMNGQSLPQPSEAVLVGFIVAVAMSELSRAALAPLPDLGKPGRFPGQALAQCKTALGWLQVATEEAGPVGQESTTVIKHLRICMRPWVWERVVWPGL